MPAIANSKILIMATHGFEESELLKPLEELKAKGATVHVASPRRARSKAGGIRIGANPSPSISRSMS